MKQTCKLLRYCVLILIIGNFASCKQQSVKKEIPKTKVESTITSQTLTLESFTDIPPEIDGGACYFSNDSAEFEHKKYIYVNDFAETSFLKINGKLIRFQQTEYKDIKHKTVKVKAVSKEYLLEIEMTDLDKSSYETTLKTGTIILSDKNGQSIKKSFYGSCGC
jgi:hypothetical protein